PTPTPLDCYPESTDPRCPPQCYPGSKDQRCRSTIMESKKFDPCANSFHYLCAKQKQHENELQLAKAITRVSTARPRMVSPPQSQNIIPNRATNEIHQDNKCPPGRSECAINNRKPPPMVITTERNVHIPTQ